MTAVMHPLGETGDVRSMIVTEPLGHEQFDTAPDDFMSGIAEHGLGARAEDDDTPLGVRDDDRLRRDTEHARQHVPVTRGGSLDGPRPGDILNDAAHA